MQLSTTHVLTDDEGRKHSIDVVVQGLPEHDPNRFLEYMKHANELAARRYPEPLETA